MRVARPAWIFILHASIAFALALLLAPRADATVRLKAPGHRVTVQGTIKIVARVTHPRRRIAFYVDGKRKRLKTGRRVGLRRVAYLNTRRLRNGRHRLTVAEPRKRGRGRKHSRLIVVSNRRLLQPARKRRKDLPPAPAPAPAGAGTWSSSFEGLNFSEWTTYRRSDGGNFGTVLAADQGIAALAGAAVAYFEVTPAQALSGQNHSKLYKSWAISSPDADWRDDDGRLYERLPNGSPAGVYSAWYFLPADYSKPDHRWSNIFQFKESYIDSDGSWRQAPQWWVDIAAAEGWSDRPAGTSGGDPLLVVNNWGGVRESPRKLLAAPRGRWFEIKADLRPGDRIDWYVDGAFWQSSPQSRYPVGVSHPSTSGWTFGVGHYGGSGKLFVDNASFAAH